MAAASRFPSIDPAFQALVGDRIQSVTEAFASFEEALTALAHIDSPFEGTPLQKERVSSLKELMDDPSCYLREGSDVAKAAAFVKQAVHDYLVNLDDPALRGREAAECAKARKEEAEARAAFLKRIEGVSPPVIGDPAHPFTGWHPILLRYVLFDPSSATLLKGVFSPLSIVYLKNDLFFELFRARRIPDVFWVFLALATPVSSIENRKLLATLVLQRLKVLQPLVLSGKISFMDLFRLDDDDSVKVFSLLPLIAKGFLSYSQALGFTALQAKTLAECQTQITEKIEAVYYISDFDEKRVMVRLASGRYQIFGKSDLADALRNLVQIAPELGVPFPDFCLRMLYHRVIVLGQASRLIQAIADKRESYAKVKELSDSQVQLYELFLEKKWPMKTEWLKSLEEELVEESLFTQLHPVEQRLINQKKLSSTLHPPLSILYVLWEKRASWSGEIVSVEKRGEAYFVKIKGNEAEVKL
jgi:hypothetical protein